MHFSNCWPETMFSRQRKMNFKIFFFYYYLGQVKVYTGVYFYQNSQSDLRTVFLSGYPCQGVRVEMTHAALGSSGPRERMWTCASSMLTRHPCMQEEPTCATTSTRSTLTKGSDYIQENFSLFRCNNSGWIFGWLLEYSMASYFSTICRNYIAKTIDNSLTRSHNSMEHFLQFTLKGADYRQPASLKPQFKYRQRLIQHF